MLKTLDRYIIRQFLGTFLFILVLIMAVAVVFDVSEKTEDFAKAHAGTSAIILRYYGNFVIYYANFFSGLIIFLAVLLFTSRLAGRSEVIAALSSGVSFPRFVRPYMIAATILTALSLYINLEVLPHANQRRFAFERAYFWTKDHVDEHHILREPTPGLIAYFESFDMSENSGTRFSLERWENGALRSKLTSDRAVYDTVSGKWHVQDWLIRDIPPEMADRDTLHARAAHTERIRRGAFMDTLIALKPSDLGQRLETASAMDGREIAAFIRAEKERGGSRAAFYEVEEYQRTAYPLATYIFTLLGVGIASRKVRGGTGLHLVFGVVLILVYIFLGKLTTVAATNAGFDPFIAVWLPNVVFALIGVWIYRSAPK